MKKTLFITLLLIPFLGYSQTTKPITGFLGIKFGSSKAIVLAAISAKGGVYVKQYSNTQKLAFSNVKLGHRESIAFMVFFVNDKACEANYIFNADVEAQVPTFYQKLVDDLNGIYGNGQATTDYTSPYEVGDGNELLGLSAGKIDYHTSWTDDQNNSIKAFITTDMQIELSYQDDILFAQYLTQQKTKEKGDY
jgi:hypothetical protein